MYLTAQHVRSGEGREAIHGFLHLHDARGSFPDDPMSVPTEHPGRLVRRKTEIPLGGNTVRSYLDLIVSDEAWRQRSIDEWRTALESIGALMEEQPTPWAIEAGELHVLFSAASSLDPSAEYQRLVESALALWSSWSGADPGGETAGAR